MTKKNSFPFNLYSGPKVPIIDYFKFKLCSEKLFREIDRTKLAETGYYNLSIKILRILITDFRNRVQPYPNDEFPHFYLDSMQTTLSLEEQYDNIQARIIYAVAFYCKNYQFSGYDGLTLIIPALEKVTEGLVLVQMKNWEGNI